MTAGFAGSAVAPARRCLIPPLSTAPDLPALGTAVHTLHGRTMGTSWSVKCAAGRRADLASVQRDIERELDAVVAQMSHWEPDSDLGRFNRAAAGTWQTLPDAFFTVLDFALQVAHASDGAFDPAAGALVDLWGFGPGGRHAEPGFTAPGAAAIDAARNVSGWQHLTLDREARRLHQPGGLRLDLSAIAKGFAVDQITRRLQGLGIESFLVEVGGELRGEGLKPDGQPWWVALERPVWADGASAPTDTMIALLGLAVATSGDYRRCFEHDGERFSHTIDPRTGRPIANGLASVTVLHADCMAADAWSTALGVLGLEAGLDCAESERLAAQFVKRTASGFEERCSSHFAAMLE